MNPQLADEFGRPMRENIFCVTLSESAKDIPKFGYLETLEKSEHQCCGNPFLKSVDCI